MIFHKLFRVASPVSSYARGQVILLCFLISLTTANQTTTEEPTTVRPHNQVRLKEVKCSDYSMTVTLLFTNRFKGRVYTRNFPHIDGCGFQVPEPYSVNIATLEIKHHSCGTMLNETSSGIFVKNRLKVRFHPTIHTKHDTTLTVFCTTPKVAAPRKIFENVFVKYDKREANLDVVLGSELNTDSFNGADFDASAFYLKVTVAKKFNNTDIVVRHCIAHDKKILDDNTTLCKMNGFYGCHESKILDENFPIMNELENVVKVLKFKDPAILTMKPLFITCGINMCESLCPRKCDQHQLHRLNMFTQFAQKVIHLNSSVISNILPEAGQGQTASHDCFFQYTS